MRTLTNNSCVQVCCIKFRKSGDDDFDVDPEAGSDEEGEYNDESYSEEGFEGDEDYEGSSQQDYEEATETDGADRDLKESDEEDEGKFQGKKPI